MSKNGAQEPPLGWVETSLGEVLPLSYGKGLTEKQRDTTGFVPVYGSSGIVGRHAQALTSGPTLIVGRKGSVGEVYYSHLPCWPIDTTYFVEATESTSLRFFGYLLQAAALGQLDKSTTIPRLSRDDYSVTKVTLPPLPEQHRIVAEIEKQFTRLDTAVAALKRTQANLKRYRASVLKAACEGRLVPTEAEFARAEGRDYEPSDRLLARILNERRAKWEADQLAKMQVQGKTPKDAKWKEKYQEPVAPDITDLPELPEGWVWTTVEQRAQTAREDIVILADNVRSSAINNHRTVWADLKELLGNLSFKKCWYCEAKQERSDMQVDHFRPKNRVSEEGYDDHHGYWWLAFAWQNFRFCCTYCNSRREDPKTGTKGGKADRFPLREEAKRCRTPEDIISDEQPVLLDPTVRADPALLWFDEDGIARPNSNDTNSWPYRRAKGSIEIYHFNHTGLKEARLAVSRECQHMVGEGDEAWKEYSRGSSVAEEKFRKAVESLGERLADTAEYSAAARSTVMGLRSEDRPWLDALLV